MSVRYEVDIWTKFRGSEPMTYKPVEDVHGVIDTKEKAIEFAESLIEVLERFDPYRYEIVEKNIVIIKELNVKSN